MVPENRSHSGDLCTLYSTKRMEERSTLWSKRMKANNGVFAGRRGCCERRNDARREGWPTTLLCQRDTFNERESVTGSCACLVLGVLLTHILNHSSFRNFLLLLQMFKSPSGKRNISDHMNTHARKIDSYKKWSFFVVSTQHTTHKNTVCVTQYQCIHISTVQPSFHLYPSSKIFCGINDNFCNQRSSFSSDVATCIELVLFRLNFDGEVFLIAAPFNSVTHFDHFIGTFQSANESFSSAPSIGVQVTIILRHIDSSLIITYPGVRYLRCSDLLVCSASVYFRS